MEPEMMKNNNLDGPVILVSKEIMYTFPFGYAYLAGYLQSKNEQVLVEFRPENEALFREFARELIAKKPLLVGFGTIYPDLYITKEIITILDELGRDFPVVVGGQMVTPTPEFAVQITGADFGVIGEGEIILHELVTALRNGGDTSKVKGLVINDGHEIISTGPGDYIVDLAELPPIPYELFPEDRWLNIGKFYAGYADFYFAPMYKFDDRIVPIHGGRGCPYTCNFCYHHSKPRYRPMDVMMAEAEMLIERFDANMIEFSDDLVISSPKRARELVDGIKQLSRPVEYSISCRFNVIKNMDDELLLDLKKSGCRIMGIGLESGSQRILDIMHKKISVEDIYNGLRRLKDAGIIPITAFMVGQLSETREDVEKSIAMLRDLIKQDKYFVSNFTITTPFPGSELYDVAFQKGLLKQHEDFYNIYDPRRDMCGISLNMSSMTDKEVVELRNRMEAIYLKEKIKAANVKILLIEKLRSRLKSFYDKISTRFFRNRCECSLIRLADKYYCFIQSWLDTTRLRIYSQADN
jgi:radical SAM superfamily enzyme YgiQ (UPF0313 family)